MAFAGAAVVISLIALYRTKEPTWPRVWIEHKSTGSAGAMLVLTCENHTGHTIKIDRLTVRGGHRMALRRSSYDPTSGTAKVEFETCDALDLDVTAAPKSSASHEFAVSFSGSSAASRPDMIKIVISMSAMRRPMKTTAKEIPVPIPEMKADPKTA